MESNEQDLWGHSCIFIIVMMGGRDISKLINAQFSSQSQSSKFPGLNGRAALPK